MRFTVVITMLAPSAYSTSSSSQCFPRASSTPACGPTSSPTPRAVSTLPTQRASGGSSRPYPSPSGSTWPSRNYRWPPRESHDPKRDIPQCHDPGGLNHPGASPCARDPAAQHRRVGGGAALEHRHIRHPAVRRFQGACSARARRCRDTGDDQVDGLIASCHDHLGAYGRNTYSLSRAAGYSPQALSITHPDPEHPARRAGSLQMAAVYRVPCPWADVPASAERERALLCGQDRLARCCMAMAVFGAGDSPVLHAVHGLRITRKCGKVCGKLPLNNIERPYCVPVRVVPRRRVRSRLSSRSCRTHLA